MIDPSSYNNNSPSGKSISENKCASLESVKEVPQKTLITDDSVEKEEPPLISSPESETSVKDEPIKEEEATVVLAETKDRRISLVAPAPPTQRKSSISQTRRMSFVPPSSQQRMSLKPNDSMGQDMAFLNR